MHHRSLAAVLGLAVLVSGCGKKPEPLPVAPPAESEPAARPTTDDADEARRRAEEEARRNEEARMREATLTEKVFFDYDISQVRPDQRPVLDRKVAILRENPAIRLRIEGHADDRGSTEYNLALGSERAEAVKAYLVGFGLAAGRFETVTYGEERPVVSGFGEQSWAQNRRGEFRVLSGIADDPTR